MKKSTKKETSKVYEQLGKALDKNENWSLNFVNEIKDDTVIMRGHFENSAGVAFAELTLVFDKATKCFRLKSTKVL